MKKCLINIFKLFFFTFLIISAIVSTDCTDRRTANNYSYEQYLQDNKEKARALIQKFNAQYFDCTNYRAAIAKSVVIDSTIVACSEKNGEYFLKTKIRSECSTKVYAKLKCTLEIFDQYKNNLESKVLIVASVHRIDESNLVSEADSIDNNSKIFNSGNSIVLSGECLALTEVPEYSRVY